MKKKKIVIVIIFILVVFLLSELIFSNFVLTVKKYNIETDFASNVKIAVITDFHAGASHIDASRIIEKTKKQAPDIIAVTGDMFDENSLTKDINGLCFMLTELCKTAPVYYSLGNHEKNVIDSINSNICDEIAKTGAVLLDDSFADVCVNGQYLRIGGMLDEVYHFFYNETSFYKSDRAKFLLEYNNTANYRVMLCHRPDSVNNYARFNVSLGDLVLCGHTHGGCLRVPWGKAVWAPDLGWFNRISYGHEKINDSDTIVCSGLTGYSFIPRVFNPCEICIVTLN